MPDSYEKVLKDIRTIHNLGSAAALLAWDQETYMPAKAAAARGEQMAALAGVIHEKMVSPAFLDNLRALAEQDLDEPARTNVREARRDAERAARIPQQLVEEIARQQSLSRDVWVKAREQSQFSLFEPALTKMLDLKKQVAEVVGFAAEPYDAMVEEYEPYTTATEIEAIFLDLRERLVPLIQAIAESGVTPGRELLSQSYPIDRQETFGRMVAEAMGFDFDAGRLDVTVHPFCEGVSPQDVRLTTRYREDELPAALFGTLHEAGHGLYEQGFMPEHMSTPMGKSVSLGIHESQSRMWENMVGRSRGFWTHFFPKLQETFPEQLGHASVDEFYAAINDVRPSFIRVEADEATYSLHIILRFELERAMFTGDLEVSDLPGAWNERMHKYLGILPENDSQGVLQDIHWSAGLFGYFPTYALGNLYAAQFFQAARREMPTLEADIESGNLLGLKQWLNEHVHHPGMRYTAGQLVKRVTGEALSASYFTDYLKAKFGPLYGV